MKKQIIFALLLVLVCTIALCACNPTDSETAERKEFYSFTGSDGKTYYALWFDKDFFPSYNVSFYFTDENGKSVERGYLLCSMVVADSNPILDSIQPDTYIYITQTDELLNAKVLTVTIKRQGETLFTASIKQ